MSAPGAESLNADNYPSPDAPQDAVEGKEEGASQTGRNLEQVVPQVATNVFTGTLYNTICFCSASIITSIARLISFGCLYGRHVTGLGENVFYIFSTKPQCTKPTYVIPGTTYDNNL